MAAGRSTLVELIPGAIRPTSSWPDYPGAGRATSSPTRARRTLMAIQFVVLAEPASRAQELLSKNVDALLGPAPQDFSTLQQNADIATVRVPGMGYVSARPQLQEHGGRVSISRRSGKRFRWRSTATRSARRSSSAGSPRYTLVTPAFPWYARPVKNAHPYDPEKAKSMLAKARSPEDHLHVDHGDGEDGADDRAVDAGHAHGRRREHEPRRSRQPTGHRWSGSPPRTSSHDSGRISSTPRCFGRAQPSFLRAAATSRTSTPGARRRVQGVAIREGRSCPGRSLEQAQTVFADQLPFVPIVTP